MLNDGRCRPSDAFDPHLRRSGGQRRAGNRMDGVTLVRMMRALAGALVALALTLAGARPAAASCFATPAPVSENAARAVAVVYGSVTSVETGALTLRVDRVLKGPVDAMPRVFVGPGRRAAGAGGVTSVDYPNLSTTVQVGSDHVLYLYRGSDGALETNACVGSHAGPPTPEELAYFGAGASPGGATTSAPTSAPVTTPAPATAPEAPASAGQISAIWPLLILLIVGLAAAGGATTLALRRRAA